MTYQWVAVYHGDIESLSTMDERHRLKSSRLKVNVTRHLDVFLLITELLITFETSLPSSVAIFD